jgi:nicotinate-nucleotide adenylyltransferase
VKVAVFGGSFNPPHVAHVLACALVLAVEDVERVVVVPTFRHPFAKPLAPYEERLAMCALAFAGTPQVEVSRVEQELGGESRTLRTLEHLTATRPEWRLRLIVGADILKEVPRWHGFDGIERLAPLIVLGRAGVDTTGPWQAGPSLLPEVSSTKVRASIAAGRWEEVGRVVPRTVLAHIRDRGLYAAPE